MDTNPSNGTGVALLWPFYAGFFSPFNLLESVSAPGWNEPLKQMKAVLPILAWEIPFYMIALILFLRK
ncbi:MAG: hypothetical protein HY760_09220 [Nitrospirae bacterium]|nr:hypothetical protein [Nitrospirota bacterium]